MKTTIEIERAWIERLLELGKQAQAEKDVRTKDQWTMLLFGYIHSAEFLLKK